MRKLFKTTRGCPISQLYLEAGHIPARYEAKRMRLLFLKYILNENPESLIFRFLQLQFENPTRGDWASTCMEDLKDLKINLSLKDIEKMSKSKFDNEIKKSIQISALVYLLGKQGSKGKDIVYSDIRMAEYLMPSSSNLTIEQKRYIFEMRNRMTPIPHNFSSSKEMDSNCVCGQSENMEHIYRSMIWNIESEKTSYGKIYSENVHEIKKIYEHFKVSFDNRNDFLRKNERMEKDDESPHVILVCDPLSSVIEFGNGNKV